MVAGWLVVAIAAAGSPAPEKAQLLARRGLNELEAGRIERAERDLHEAVTADPGSPEAHEGLGRLAMARGDWAGALGELLRARTLYRERALTLLQQRAEAARREEVTRQSFKDMVGRFSDSGCWTETSYRHRIPGAAEMDGRVEAPDVQELPLPRGLAFRIGVCLLHLGRAGEARQALLDELRVSPRSPAVYANLAVAEWRLGRPAEALRALDRVRELGGREPPGLRQEIRRAMR